MSGPSFLQGQICMLALILIAWWTLFIMVDVGSTSRDVEKQVKIECLLHKDDPAIQEVCK